MKKIIVSVLLITFVAGSVTSCRGWFKRRHNVSDCPPGLAKQGRC